MDNTKVRTHCAGDLRSEKITGKNEKSSAIRPNHTCPGTGLKQYGAESGNRTGNGYPTIQ